MTEEWRDVVGFEANYEVSSHGRVRRKDTAHVLRPWVAGAGYHYVHLHAVPHKRKAGIHVLVAEAFCGPKPSSEHEVAHWDGVATNNYAWNVRWATRGENIEDQRRHGTLHAPVMQGESHPRAKLRDHDVLHIRSAYSGTRGELTAIARTYGLSLSTIARAVTGTMWRHL
jgi:hypothetical protein